VFNLQNKSIDHKGGSSQTDRLATQAALVRACAAVTAVLGLTVLLGWTVDVPLLKSVLPGAVEMKANTAVGLMLAACALFILGNRPSPPGLSRAT
jgi:hypothetical protein